MGFFSGIWAGTKAVLGFSNASKGADNVMKVASGIGGWIDGQKFTEQEKAEMNMKMVGYYGDFMQSTVGENTQRSITRRELAIWIIRTEIIMLVISVILHKIDPAWGAYVYTIATESPLGLLTLGVGAFFFGTHLVRATKGQ
jgi:hypothetical protein